MSHYSRVYSQDVASVSFLIQGKILIIGTPKIITVIVLKNGRLWFYSAVMQPKDPDGKANNKDSVT